jgi:hypothetical protein
MPLTAVMPAPPSALVTCPQPITLPVKLDNCILGGHASDRNFVKQTILKISNENSFVSEYMLIVFSYLENFAIRIAPASNQNTDRGFSRASYSVVTRTLTIRHNTISDLDFMPALYHEFRHAYWHVMQLYAFKNRLSSNSDNFYPQTIVEQEKISRYLQQGFARIETIAHYLLKEDQLKSDKKALLEKWRHELSKSSELYLVPYRVDLDYPGGRVPEFVVGQEYHMQGNRILKCLFNK